MKLLSVCSARPNFVKLAAVHHAVEARRGAGGEIEHVIVHTGQHHDPILSDVFFEQLDIPDPVVNLGVSGGTREQAIDKTRLAMLPVLREEQPDWVLAYGDVNGAVGAALAARECGVKLAHVEAGLRSFDLEMPEELNRIAIDAIADLLLCSERSGMENLEKENAPGARVLAGNTMIDTLLRMMPAVQSRANSLELLWDLPFALATLHRPSNVDDPAALRANIAFLAEVAAAGPQVLLVCHHRLKAALESSGITPAWETAHTHEGIRMVEPFPYLQFIRAAQLSAFVLTDSGGLQEEAVLLGKRCFTLRRNTERPSTIESGSNVLVDPAVPADRERVLAFAAKPEDPAVRIPPLWDGNAGARIIDALLAA